MLALHPSSTCDICFELYKGSRAPHSIPCGHVFCKECLNSVAPRLCPLCRHPFGVQAIRKLHVGAPEPDREMELMSKVLLRAMDQEAGLFVVAEEVTEWLAGGPGKDMTALAGVVKLAEGCTKLCVQHRRDKTRIQALEYASRRLEQIVDACDVHEVQALQSEVKRGRKRIAQLEHDIDQINILLLQRHGRTIDPALEKDSRRRRRQERDVAFESVIRAFASRQPLPPRI